MVLESFIFLYENFSMDSHVVSLLSNLSVYKYKLVTVMAELHVIGEISHARKFPKQSLFCKWNLQFGNNWKLVSGKQEGQTHVISSEFEDDCKWCFPIDIHLATKGIQGWPKIYIQVFHLDWLGRSHLFGYGFILIPTTAGQHTVECFTWRPFGTLRQRFVQFFLGGGPQLKHPDLIISGNDRNKLSTEAMGIVQFQINVIFRNFSKFGVEY